MYVILLSGNAHSFYKGVSVPCFCQQKMQENEWQNGLNHFFHNLVLTSTAIFWKIRLGNVNLSMFFLSRPSSRRRHRWEKPNPDGFKEKALKMQFLDGFKLMNQDDYFQVDFDHFWSKRHFWGSWGSSGNWLQPKTKPSLRILTNLSVSKSVILTAVVLKSSTYLGQLALLRVWLQKKRVSTSLNNSSLPTHILAKHLLRRFSLTHDCKYDDDREHGGEAVGESHD